MTLQTNNPPYHFLLSNLHTGSRIQWTLLACCCCCTQKQGFLNVRFIYRLQIDAFPWSRSLKFMPNFLFAMLGCLLCCPFHRILVSLSGFHRINVFLTLSHFSYIDAENCLLLDSCNWFLLRNCICFSVAIFF